MTHLKIIFLLLTILFLNSCAVEDGTRKAPFWIISGSNQITYKYDYSDWDNSTITSSSISIRDTASNNSKELIAVGFDGNIWQSVDKGLSWDNRTSGSGITSRLWEILYENGKYVAVGNDGIIITSNDGITWDNRTSGVAKVLRGIAYGNSKYVTVGFDGTVLTSSDSTSWTKQTEPTVNDFFGLSYLNSKFIGVGESGMIMTSSDGITWDNKTSGSTEKFKEVSYGNGIYVAVATNGVIYTSSDTDSWTSRSSGTTNDLWAVDFGNGEFISGGTGFVGKSTDGITWTQIFTRSIQSVIYVELDTKKYVMKPKIL